MPAQHQCSADERQHARHADHDSHPLRRAVVEHPDRNACQRAGELHDTCAPGNICAAAASGAYASKVITNVRRGVLGTMIERAVVT